MLRGAARTRRRPMTDATASGRCGPHDDAPQVISSRGVYHGKIISVRVDEITIPGRGTATREVVDHPGAIVVAAVDGVITKPGYGIVADCLAHGTPIIYTDRGFFPEYDILVQEIETQLTTVYLSSSDLYGGRWKSAITQLESQTRTIPDISCDGAQVCAEIILRHLS